MLWPVGFKPARADSFAHNTLLIHAECGNVYSYLAAVRAWPDWLVFARNVSLVAPATELRAGTKFRWTIFGLPIVSTVFVAESGHRLGWTNQPSGPPPRYAQSWLLKRQRNGYLVVTEEVGLGADAAAAAKKGDTRTHRAHDLWLASLKWIALGGIRSE